MAAGGTGGSGVAEQQARARHAVECSSCCIATTAPAASVHWLQRSRLANQQLLGLASLHRARARLVGAGRDSGAWQARDAPSRHLKHNSACASRLLLFTMHVLLTDVHARIYARAVDACCDGAAAGRRFKTQGLAALHVYYIDHALDQAIDRAFAALKKPGDNQAAALQQSLALGSAHRRPIDPACTIRGAPARLAIAL